jgi:hypothetical protein
VAHPGLLGADQGEYLTHLAALGELLGRIEGHRKDPKTFSVTVVSLREGVIKQLDGSYRVRAPGLQPLHAQAQGLLGRFGTVDLAWRPNAEVAKLMKAGS